jgi:small subunit ribosomal protein S16
MVRIRLRRVGKKGQPSYRVVVADKESPRDGRFIEIIGFYNPRTNPPTMEIKDDRALYWLSQGAQPSDAVARMLRKLGIMARFEAQKRGEPLPPLTPLSAEAETSAVAEAAEVVKEATANAEIEASAEAEVAEAEVAAEAEAASEADAAAEAEPEADAEEAPAEEPAD